MTPNAILDTQALRAAADGSPQIERQLLLLYIVTAEKCLMELQGLVVYGDRREWLAVTRELRIASAKIHAGQLTTLCADANDSAHDAASRMRVYTEIKDAYQRLVSFAQRANLFQRAAGET